MSNANRLKEVFERIVDRLVFYSEKDLCDSIMFYSEDRVKNNDSLNTEDASIYLEKIRSVLSGEVLKRQLSRDRNWASEQILERLDAIEKVVGIKK